MKKEKFSQCRCLEEKKNDLRTGRRETPGPVVWEKKTFLGQGGEKRGKKRSLHST